MVGDIIHMLLSRVQLFVIPWTVAYQVPPSVKFSRQEYWSGLPFPSPGDLPDPGIESRSPALQADALPSEPPGTPEVRNTEVLNKCFKSAVEAGIVCLILLRSSQAHIRGAAHTQIASAVCLCSGAL